MFCKIIGSLQEHRISPFGTKPAPNRLNWISGQHICHPHRASATQKGDFGFGSVVMEKEEQGHEKFKLWVIYAFIIYLFRYFRAVQPTGVNNFCIRNPEYL